MHGHQTNTALFHTSRHLGLPVHLNVYIKTKGDVFVSILTCVLSDINLIGNESLFVVFSVLYIIKSKPGLVR